MEENGVGRPSTYAPTIETIQKRYYVKVTAKRFEPTELGTIVNGLISTYFPDIVNISFTAGMEQDLDSVEEGKMEWVKVVDRFYKPFAEELAKAEVEIEKIEIKDEPAGFDCELCGHPMVIKIGRFGKFYACSNFPECRNTKPIVKKINVTCPVCKKGEVIERKSKKIGYSMGVIVTQSANSSPGTNRLAVIARNVNSILLRRRSKAASK